MSQPYAAAVNGNIPEPSREELKKLDMLFSDDFAVLLGTNIIGARTSI